jgi:hypothetical protein
VYLFHSPTAGTDVYGHREASVTDPDAHQFGPRTPGDPDRIVRTTIEATEIEAREREL